MPEDLLPCGDKRPGGNGCTEESRPGPFRILNLNFTYRDLNFTYRERGTACRSRARLGFDSAWLRSAGSQRHLWRKSPHSGYARDMSARSKREPPVKVRGWLMSPLIGVFIALKLADVTDWSWWWVLSPLWIAAALVVVAAGALALLFMSLALYARIRLRFRLRRAFPEVFIDPAVWSRNVVDHSDTASSLRVTAGRRSAASRRATRLLPGSRRPRVPHLGKRPARPPWPLPATDHAGREARGTRRSPPKGIGHGDQDLVACKPVPSQDRLTTGTYGMPK